MLENFLEKYFMNTNTTKWLSYNLQYKMASKTSKIRKFSVFVLSKISKNQDFFCWKLASLQHIHVEDYEKRRKKKKTFYRATTLKQHQHILYAGMSLSPTQKAWNWWETSEKARKFEPKQPKMDWK